MVEKISKKSYYLPETLMKSFAEWSKPGRNYSPSIAGAVLVWMTLDPEFREAARRLATSKDINSSIREVADLLRKSVVDAEIQRFLNTVSDSQKARILIDIEASKENIDHMK